MQQRQEVSGVLKPHVGVGMKELLALRLSAAERVVKAQAVVDDIDTELRSRVSAMIAAARRMHQKFEGAIDIVVDGCDVKSTVPKKIKWDQKKLADGLALVADSGLVDPNSITKIEMTIPEKVWGGLSAEVQALLSEARTLEHGKEKIEYTARSE